MRIIDRAEVDSTLSYPVLVQALRDAFAQPSTVPRRSLFPLSDAPQSRDALGVQTAWTADTIAIKTFTWLPDNPAHGRDTVHAKILLFDRSTGTPLALVDGTSVTLWRTAAVSALAADYLARPNARVLLLCGTGALAPCMALAHAAVRPIGRVLVWGRRHERAVATAAAVRDRRADLDCDVVNDLQTAAQEADVISCATASLDPLVFGASVCAGTHVDLVGNHDRTGRECDTELILKSRVYVDTRTNVLGEAGELLIPVAEGAFSPEQVVGELSELCTGVVSGRTDDTQVTLFKSVGTALSDLAAARLVLRLRQD